MSEVVEKYSVWVLAIVVSVNGGFREFPDVYL
jgi:hypothetical protein